MGKAGARGGIRTDERLSEQGDGDTYEYSYRRASPPQQPGKDALCSPRKKHSATHRVD